MSITNYKPTTAGRRNISVADYSQLFKKSPEESLLEPLNKKSDRSSYGRITIRHRGGRNCKKYRVIDFKYQRADAPTKVLTLEYDPNCSTFIALIQYEDGQKSYIIAPHGPKVDDTVVSGTGTGIKPSDASPPSMTPTGTFIHNVELYPGKDGQPARSAGNWAQLMAKEDGTVLLRLPSGELRNISQLCMATIGQVSNFGHENVKVGKIGRKRHMGWRPTVRGSVINPDDHPYDGGEGESLVGRPGPVTPWDRPTLDYKARSKKDRPDEFIVKRRSNK